MPSKQEASRDSGNAALGTAYLIFYNFIQFLGWTAILFTVTLHIMAEGTHVGVYHSVAGLLYVFQTAAILEVVHAMVGLVRSNWVLTAFQVASRVFLTWGITFSVKQVQNEYSVLMFLVAWSVTEIVRYSYYAFSIIDQVPPFLTWARYTFFIVLYPIGVTGELLSIYHSLGHVQRSGLYSVRMPNAANMSFSYYFFLFAVMATYIPVFPQLYMHMFHQRGKILGGGQKKQD